MISSESNSSGRIACLSLLNGAHIFFGASLFLIAMADRVKHIQENLRGPKTSTALAALFANKTVIMSQWRHVLAQEEGAS